jgi:release factor glutamine methyltransferase
VTVAVATSVEALRRKLAAKLKRAFAADGRDGAPALDARLLLAHAMGVEPAALATRGEDLVPPEIETRTMALVERRIAGEPVARIVGRQEFWSLELAIGPGCLLPRPDSETLVEAALEHLVCSGRRGEPVRLLDIGTGSGAILLALLSELPSASGVATDCSERALDIARQNARRLGLDSRARFIASDWARAIGGRFDLVLANPPYIESETIAGLQIEVRKYDPYVALNGGADGMDAFRAILGDLDRLLTGGGRAFLEIGIEQAGALSQLAEKHDFAARFHRDLAGINRVAELGRVADI